MEKNCMNCTRRCVVFNMDCKPENRCSLDPDMKVNARMCCEEWTNMDVVRIASGDLVKALTNARVRRRDIQSLIQM